MAAANSTDCASADCSRVFLNHPLTLAGNALILAIFAVLIPISLALGVRYRSAAFATIIATGLALEVVGYIGRLLLHNDPSGIPGFAVFLVGTTLGPTIICGAMFLVVPRIVAMYGEDFRSWRGSWYLPLLASLSAVSFVLELAGSIVAATHDAIKTVDTGGQVLAVGLGIQLIALFVFALHATLFAIAVRSTPKELDTTFAPIYNSSSFSMFLAVFTVVTVLAALRTSYRIVEIAEGFGSSLAQTETLFLVLDGAVMLIACILLLAFFPPRIMGVSWSKATISSLSPTPSSQPIHLVLDRSTISRPNPKNRMSMRSSESAHSPRKSNHQTPPQRDMVNSDNLW